MPVEREVSNNPFGGVDREARKKTLKKLFNKKAREGYDIVDGDRTRHVPGWYEEFPDLSHKKIDKILKLIAQSAHNASLVIFVGALIIRDLRRASFEERKKKEKEQIKYLV